MPSKPPSTPRPDGTYRLANVSTTLEKRIVDTAAQAWIAGYLKRTPAPTAEKDRQFGLLSAFTAGWALTRDRFEKTGSRSAVRSTKLGSAGEAWLKQIAPTQKKHSFKDLLLASFLAGVRFFKTGQL